MNTAPAYKDRLGDALKALQEGRIDEAERICTAILDDESGHPDALNIMGIAHAMTGRLAEAEQFLKQAVRLHPDDARAQANLGHFYVTNRRFTDAATAYREAVFSNPDNHIYKQNLNHCFQYAIPQTDHKRTRDVMSILLADETLDHQEMAASWRNLYELDVSFSKDSSFEALPDLSDIQDNFLPIGLQKMIAASPVFEKDMTILRRLFLEQKDSIDPAYYPLLSALGCNCFLTGYAFFVEADEEAEAESLLAQCKAQDPGSVDQALFLILACYYPLNILPEAASIAEKLKKSENSFICNMVRMQIDEPLTERDIKKDIKSLKPIQDGVSQAVQNQYEENPYPHWLSPKRPILTKEQVQNSAGRKILVAGCGTGFEPVQYALNNPLADIQAIDLSTTSLAYGIRKARELGIENIHFMHADILEVANLPGSFDIVSSCGVLHHMKDPAAGLQALFQKLKPEGLMKLALYSTKARRGLLDVQNYIKEHNIPATQKDIRAFRKTAMNDPKMLKALIGIRDFYSLSECRDLVFHVQEHCFDLLQIDDMCDKIGLRILKMSPSTPSQLQQYQQRFPDDMEGSNVKNWHEFEQNYPDTFIRMYQFWTCRKESETETVADWIHDNTGELVGI